MGKLRAGLPSDDFVKIQRKLDGWRLSATTTRWCPKDNLKGWRVYLGKELPSDQKAQIGGYFSPHYGNHPETGNQNDEMISLFFVDKNDSCVEYYVEYEQLLKAVDSPSFVQERCERDSQ